MKRGHTVALTPYRRCLRRRARADTHAGRAVSAGSSDAHKPRAHRLHVAGHSPAELRDDVCGLGRGTESRGPRGPEGHQLTVPLQRQESAKGNRKETSLKGGNL